jgi:hypothetical protein
MALLIRNIRLNKIEWASVVDKGASGDAENRPRIVLWKREDKSLAKRIAAALGFKKQTKPADEMPCIKAEAPMDPTLELTLDQLKLNDDQKAAVLKMLEAAKGGPTTPDKPKGEALAPEAGAAPIPEGLKKRLDDADAKTIALEKSNKELADKLAMVEFAKQANALSFLPEKTETITQILKRASERGDKDLPILLEKLNKAMKESPVFKEYGNGSSDDEGAHGKLETIAKKYREADPKITHAAALVKAAKDNPDLYAEARKAE